MRPPSIEIAISIPRMLAMPTEVCKGRIGKAREPRRQRRPHDLDHALAPRKRRRPSEHVRLGWRGVRRAFERVEHFREANLVANRPFAPPIRGSTRFRGAPARDMALRAFAAPTRSERAARRIAVASLPAIAEQRLPALAARRDLAAASAVAARHHELAPVGSHADRPPAALALGARDHGAGLASE